MMQKSLVEQIKQSYPPISEVVKAGLHAEEEAHVHILKSNIAFVQRSVDALLENQEIPSSFQKLGKQWAYLRELYEDRALPLARIAHAMGSDRVAEKYYREALKVEKGESLGLVYLGLGNIVEIQERADRQESEYYKKALELGNSSVQDVAQSCLSRLGKTT